MGLILNSIREIYQRDLNILKEELNNYKNEEDIWRISGEIANSAGNLSLHISGNLQHFIGSVLGKNGYSRDRDLEFSAINVSREKLLQEIDITISTVDDTLNTLSAIDLQSKYPQEIMGKEVRTGYFLIHLASHLNYHLGQINYHRRLI